MAGVHWKGWRRRWRRLYNGREDLLASVDGRRGRVRRREVHRLQLQVYAAARKVVCIVRDLVPDRSTDHLAVVLHTLHLVARVRVVVEREVQVDVWTVAKPLRDMQ